MRTFGPLHLFFHDDDVDDEPWEPFLRDDDAPLAPPPVAPAAEDAPSAA